MRSNKIKGSMALWNILKSHKIKSTFYKKHELLELLSKLNSETLLLIKKYNIVYEIDCTNCQVVSFDESERSLK